MYSTKNAITISIKDILDKLSDYDIYSYYIGQFKIGKLINSPLRSDDNNPSFAIFKGANNGLFFKDHGSGEGGNALKFIKLIKNITTREELEKELLRIVRKVNPNVNSAKRTYSNLTITTPMTIGIVRQPFTKTDIEFWKKFNIHIDTLKKYNVFSIKYYLCNNTVRGIYKEDNPMYAYKIYDRFKIYRPYASKYVKWRSNTNTEHVQGMEQLPSFGNLLIITKSLKDVMCLYEMGYNSISSSSETTFLPKNILESLKERWKHNVILYDRDKTGVAEARKYSKQFNLDAIFVHKRFKSKDISDAIMNNSFDSVKKWLNKTLRIYG